MATTVTFEDFFELPLKMKPEQRFQPAHLRQLFFDKIVRSRATGKDGIRVATFEANLEFNVHLISRKVLDSSFKFTPFKQRLLLKGPGKPPREICIPTVRDRLVLRAVCQNLHENVPASTGYSPHAVVNRVAKALRASPKGSSFVRVDVRNFFPSIQHEVLETELGHFNLDPITKRLCLEAVKTRIGSAKEPPELGVAQGLSISGALACIYLLRFDDRQARRFPSYFRYVDDILLICEAGEGPRTLNSIRRALSHLRLRAHPLGTDGKTEISNTEDGIDYLGYRIQRDMISVKKASFRRMFSNILKDITDYRYRNDPERLVFRLNLKITGCLIDEKRRGWMMFFSRTENMKQLAHLDSFVKSQLSRVDFPNDYKPRIKRFIKSYNEICFNLDKTDYIPKFDEFDLSQKTEAVAILLGRPLEEIQAFDVEDIQRNFSRLVGQEVHELEIDVGSLS